MLRRVVWAVLASTVFSGLSATAVLSADADEFADFPDVPDMERMERSFRDAGFYLGARGGVGFADDTQFTITGPTGVHNAYDLGYVGSGFVGLELPDLYHGLGLRLEAELGLAQFEIDTHNVGGAVVASANSFGATDSLYGMVNLYLDYSGGMLRPFLGGGIGVAQVEFDNHGIATAPGVMDNSANGFAWQVMGGLGVDITSAISLEAMVRYQGVEDVGLISSTGPKSQVDLGATQVMLGARFSF